jgi:HD-GYP domain-containing protein (c-di-GMP phosphodiesterase class II)
VKYVSNANKPVSELSLKASSKASPTIAVEDLQLGMFIQLDGGWLAHPFPLSNFRLTTPQQLAAVRGLGLAQVRWVPEKSDLGETPAANASPMPADVEQAPDTAQAPAQPSTNPRSARFARAAPLPVEIAAALHCEQQHAEAEQVLLGALSHLHECPQEVGRTTVALTQAMLDKMLATPDVGIRLVSAGPNLEAAHAMNVSVISLLIGRALGLQGDDLLDLGVGALLHDVGNASLPERCRHLDNAFSAADVQCWRDHVTHGVLQGQRMALSAGALEVLAQHHEQADGLGFPNRLTNDRISLAARVVAIVDRYDTLCNPQNRDLPLTPHEAVARLFAQSRQRFDGAVLNAFIRMMGVYPAGSLVQLTDDRFAMVVGANSSRPLKPRVLVHDEQVPRAQALLLDLEREPNLGIRRSLTASRVPSASLHYLDPRPRVSYFFEPLAAIDPALELAA